MTTEHPRWDEFVNGLQQRLGDPDEGKCNTDFDQSRKVLHGLGLSAAEIAESFEWFADHHGGCDCEILLNIAYGGES